MSTEFSFTLDGRAVCVQADPKASTLDVLREQLGCFTLKAGCAPQGLCGCCSILVDGKPRLSCTLPVKTLEGKSVRTLDGADELVRSAVAAGFAAAGAAQCGYCTPGIALSTCSLLAANPAPTLDECHRALAPHTCRCTGYTALLDGMQRAGAALRGEAVAGPEEAAELVLGVRPYVDDLVREGALVAVLVSSPVAHGTVRELDVSAARALDGVFVEELVSVGGAVERPGTPLVIVAADSLAAARAAASAVRTMVEPGPQPAPQVVARARRRDEGVDAALAACPLRTQTQLKLAPTDSAALEPEAALAVPGPEGVIVYTSAEDAAEVRRVVADWVPGEVDVRLLPSGGSYGARVGASVEPYAARLAVRTGRPVRLGLDHEEATRQRARRAGARVRGELGASADGTLRALKLEVHFEGGAHAPHADRLCAEALAAVAYPGLAVALEVSVECGGGSPTAPLRGGGLLPVVAAVEAMVETLAVAAGQDPMTFRRRQLPAEAQAVLDALSEPWLAAAGAPRGLSVSRTEPGPPPQVWLDVVSDGEVEVRCNVPELGQGRDTALLDTLAEATGLAREHFTVVWAEASRIGSRGSGPVESAARAAGAALAAQGGPLVAGTRVHGQGAAAAPAYAAHLAVLNAEGGVVQVMAAATVGRQSAEAARRLLEGTGAMGVGIALSEAVTHTDANPESRFRYLGTLKSKVTPPLRAAVVPAGDAERDLSDVGVGAAAAVHVAVGRAEGRMRESWPMKDSAAARSVGVRVR